LVSFVRNELPKKRIVIDSKIDVFPEPFSPRIRLVLSEKVKRLS